MYSPALLRILDAYFTQKTLIIWLSDQQISLLPDNVFCHTDIYRGSGSKRKNKPFQARLEKFLRHSYFKIFIFCAFSTIVLRKKRLYKTLKTLKKAQSIPENVWINVYEFVKICCIIFCKWHTCWVLVFLIIVLTSKSKYILADDLCRRWNDKAAWA